eukprot:3344561-Amphidinium_carterae.1
MGCRWLVEMNCSTMSNKWSEIWATHQHAHPEELRGDPLPPITGDMVRATANRSKWNKAVGHDGVSINSLVHMPPHTCTSFTNMSPTKV